MKVKVYRVFVSICLAVGISRMVGVSADPSAIHKEHQLIGRVIQIQGNVFARYNNVERQLQLKSPVFLNDRIFTKERARVQILLNDDSIISQGEKGELVLDEYTYKPKERDKTSCSLRLIKGFFRIITGKITDLSPDRFTVRSNMATIGIRGCDLGWCRRYLYILFACQSFCFYTICCWGYAVERTRGGNTTFSRGTTK